jgi:hypothetical protein
MKISAIRVVQIVALIATLTPRQALVLSHTGQIPANIRSSRQRTCRKGELQVPRWWWFIPRGDCILLRQANPGR